MALTSSISTNSSIQSYPANFIKAAAYTVITQIALFKTRSIDLEDSIGINYHRMSQMRGFAKVNAAMLATILFFRNKGETPLQFIKRQPMRILIYMALTAEAVFIRSIKEKLEKIDNDFWSRQTNETAAKALSLAEKICIVPKKLNDLISGAAIRSIGKLADNPTILKFYTCSLVPAVVEEIIYRGIIQELLLRKLPKLALKSCCNVAPESLDHPIFKCMRILGTSALFGIAHYDDSRGRLFHALSAALAGIEFGYLNEDIGLPAAILSHYAHDLYVCLEAFKD